MQDVTISPRDLVCQIPGYIVSDMNGEKVMLSVKNGKYYNLGAVGGDIWELAREPISGAQIVSELISQYDVDERKCEEQVLAFLEALLKEGLIRIAPQE